MVTCTYTKLVPHEDGVWWLYREQDSKMNEWEFWLLFKLAAKMISYWIGQMGFWLQHPVWKRTRQSKERKQSGNAKLGSTQYLVPMFNPILVRINIARKVIIRNQYCFIGDHQMRLNFYPHVGTPTNMRNLHNPIQPNILLDPLGSKSWSSRLLFVNSTSLSLECLNCDPFCYRPNVVL